MQLGVKYKYKRILEIKMKEVSFGEERGRTWLTCDYDSKLIKYSYPPVQGTHQDCQ